jgi:cyclopropane fatty-acyl-phospholipid synthase-like methyltransferase
MTHCKICSREVDVTTEKNHCKILQCTACNFFFSDAHTTPEYYDKKYWNEHDAGWKERNKKSNLQVQLGNILHHNPKAKKILDFGCGYGNFTTYLREKGYDAYGCNPFPALPKKDYLAPDYTPWLHLYDAITMIEVLEHLTDPLNILKDLREATQKKGTLHIQTQIWNEDQTIEKWWYCDPPNHCNYFTTQSMERILTLSGWKVKYMSNLNIVAEPKNEK